MAHKSDHAAALLLTRHPTCASDSCTPHESQLEQDEKVPEFEMTAAQHGNIPGYWLIGVVFSKSALLLSFNANPLVANLYPDSTGQ